MTPRLGSLLLCAGGALTLLAASGCDRPVDPAYLREVEAAAEEECACSKDPARLDDCSPEHSLQPKPPPGAPADYEATLDDASREKLADARKRHHLCAETRARAAVFKGDFDKRHEQIMNPERD